MRPLRPILSNLPPYDLSTASLSNWPVNTSFPNLGRDSLSRRQAAGVGVGVGIGRQDGKAGGTPGTGVTLQMLEGHSGWVWGLAFSSDGKQLVSASGNRTVKL